MQCATKTLRVKEKRVLGGDNRSHKEEGRVFFCDVSGETPSPRTCGAVCKRERKGAAGKVPTSALIHPDQA